MTTAIVTKPFLKWVGGKSAALDDILALFPATIRDYHEPFVGGGSVLFGLLARIYDGSIILTGRIYASDLNPALIALYKNIQTDPNAVIEKTKELVADFRAIEGNVVRRDAATREEAVTSRESYYYWVRSRYNALTAEERTAPAASAMLLFMNKTCFRGVYREGPRGFNVPYGNYKNPIIMDEGHIREVAALIKDVVFTAAPFDASLARVGAGDFVYLDPPYVPETATSFVSYTADGFDAENHRRLFALCGEICTRGAAFVLSNSNAAPVREAFTEPSYTTRVITRRRAIHSKKPDTTAEEVLITNRRLHQ